MQFAESIKEFQRAIALNPNYATAHQWYGEALQNDGRFDESVAELKRARELDPLSLIINASLGETLASARRYEEAIEQLRKTIEMDPTFYVTYWFLGDAFRNKGDLSQAIAESEKAAQLDPDPAVLGALGHAYAMVCRKEDSHKILDKLTTLSEQRYVRFFACCMSIWLSAIETKHCGCWRRAISTAPPISRGSSANESSTRSVVIHGSKR